MDPFSLAVGVAGLLGLVGKIIELTSKYTKGVKHAAAAASELLDTLETLGSVLSRLDGLLKDDTKQAFPSTSALATSINACRNKLIVVHTKLEETAKHPSKRLLWPLSSNNHQETLRDLRTCAQWIQFALTIDGSTLMAKTSDEVVQVLGNQLDMFHRVGSLETNVHTTHKVVVDTHRKIVDLDAASRRGKILDWISNDKAEQKHHEIRLPRLTGTGAWLLQDSSFELWRDQTLDSCESPSVLWCYGIPGSGKSILASLVIDHLRYISADTQTPVAHVYFDYNNQEFQSLEKILASLVKQLVSARKMMPTALTALYDRLSKQGKTLQYQDLVLTLGTVCREVGKVFFVIDALDECVTMVRKDFIGLLRTSFSDCVSLFVTSRYHPADIRESFSDCARIEIKAQSSDLRLYLTHEVEHSDWCDEIDDGLAMEIADKIVRAAKKMFLLAVLHIQTVLLEPTIGQMIEALNNLPQSLEAAFDKTMRRIRDQRNHRRELALNCLMWITFARRPLIFEELSDAIAITTKPEMTAMDETYRMFRPPQKILTDCCHGLIVVDEESSIVRLVHYSVHEYLCHGQPPIFPRAEKAVAELCIAYQMLETFASGCRREEEDIIRLLDDCPFIAYAARHWGSHVAAVDDSGLTTKTLGFLQAKPQQALSHQIWQYVGGRREEYWNADEANSCNGLHVASMFGLTNIAKELLPKYHIDTPTYMGTTALIKAASAGFRDLVRLYLSMGANTTKNNWYGTALHCAAEAGKSSTINELLDTGVDVNLEDRHGRAPLTCAVLSGHAGAARTLLSRGAYVNHTDHTNTTPLLDAIVVTGSLDVVHTLLEFHADPNITSAYGGTPLQLATYSGDVELVRTLLDCGADIDACGGGGQAALHVAATCGGLDVVALLLERGAAIDRLSACGFTALYMASARNQLETVRILIRNGASTELAEDLGFTPLQVAARCNHAEVLQLLLEAGADLDARSNHGITALTLTRAHGSEDCEKLLLNKGAKD